MFLNFLENECKYTESYSTIFIDFMLRHKTFFNASCSICPVGYCYRYFIGMSAVFQIVNPSKIDSNIL